jgi:signal transduction histidine kinase
MGTDPAAWPMVERRTQPRVTTMPPVFPGANERIPLVTALRWCTLAIGATIVAPRFADAHGAVLVWCALLPVHAVLRTVRPLRFGSGPWSMAEVASEVAIAAGAASTTGYWRSPFVFCLLTAIIAAGFSRSYRFAVQVSVASALAVALPKVVLSGRLTGTDVQDIIQWTLMLLLVAMVAGYARQISTESQLLQSKTLDQLGQLSEANALLHALHQVAQSLPASLDREEVLDSFSTQVHGLLPLDALTILLHQDGLFVPVRREGNRHQTPINLARMPAQLRQAVHSDRVVTISTFPAGEFGLAPGSVCGMYGPLRARGVLIGAIVVESLRPDTYVAHHCDVLRGLTEPLALAIDNADSFARLRLLGMEEERTRIARDLHDRIGQSLAFVGFELDRVIRVAHRGEDVAAALESVRDDVRNVVGEVRETLYDLRTDVSESKDAPSTLRAYLDRVRVRSDLLVTLDVQGTDRLSLPVERELWRIAKEAITNVERHAKATHLTVRWLVGPRTAELVVTDDGVGLASGGAARADSFGIVGMRERASSINARLDLNSGPGGTTLRVQLVR